MIETLESGANDYLIISSSEELQLSHQVLQLQNHIDRRQVALVYLLLHKKNKNVTLRKKFPNFTATIRYLKAQCVIFSSI